MLIQERVGDDGPTREGHIDSSNFRDGWLCLEDSAQYAWSSSCKRHLDVCGG